MLKDNRHNGIKFHIPLVVLLTFLTYSNAVNAPFYFDDYSNILRNPRLEDLASFWPPSGTRFFTYLSFALNYHAHGLVAYWYHLTNIAIHASNAALVYVLVLYTFKTPLLKTAAGTGVSPCLTALFSSLLFALHPVQTEAVTYITQRFTSLAVLFYLLSLVLFIRWRLSERGVGVSYLLSLIFAVMAQMTKEISYTLPFLIIFYDFIFFKGQPKGRRLHLLPFALTLLIIPYMLFFADTALDISARLRSAQLEELETLSRHDYLITQFKVIVTYLRLIVLPVGQNLDYDLELSRSFFEPGVLASFLFLLLVFTSALFVFIRAYRRDNGLLALASFGVIWFFATVSIESSIIPIKDIIFEHRLYLPSIGLAFGTSTLVFYSAEGFKAGRRRGALVLVLAAVALGAAAYSRNDVWADKLALWKDIAEKSPNKARAHINLGLAYRETGLLNEAIAEYGIALTLEPDNPVLLNNMGVARLMLGQAGEAVPFIEKALALRPDYEDARNSLGFAYFSLNRTDEAIAEYREALRLRPGFAEARRNLERALEKKNEGN